MAVAESSTHARCYLCEREHYVELHPHGQTNAPGPVVKCQHCGLIYVVSQPSNSAYHHYDLDLTAEERAQKLQPKLFQDDKYLQEQRWRGEDFRRRLSKTWEFQSGGRLLDIGCSTGTFLQVAQEQGYDVTGVEPWSDVAGHALRQGFDVVSKTLREAQFESATFDVVTLIHVLEHLPEPKQELREIHRVLKPGGVLVVEVPNIASLGYQLTRRKWRNFIKTHLIHFTPVTLKKMLEDCGFSVFEEQKVGRTMSLALFEKRLTQLFRPAGRLAGRLMAPFGLKDRSIHINLRDIQAMWARPV